MLRMWGLLKHTAVYWNKVCYLGGHIDPKATPQCPQLNLRFYLLSYFYRSLFGCTSIVASDSNGNIIHGRNLDYGAAGNLRDITIEVEFQKSGEVYRYTVYNNSIEYTSIPQYTCKPSVNFTASINTDEYKRVGSGSMLKTLDLYHHIWYSAWGKRCV